MQTGGDGGRRGVAPRRLLEDAPDTVIRMVLVPAFMQAMGKWNWWPGGRKKVQRSGGGVD